MMSFEKMCNINMHLSKIINVYTRTRGLIYVTNTNARLETNILFTKYSAKTSSQIDLTKKETVNIRKRLEQVEPWHFVYGECAIVKSSNEDVSQFVKCNTGNEGPLFRYITTFIIVVSKPKITS